MNPAKVKIKTRPRAAHEVSLLTVTASRVIEMEDTAMASGSSGTPSTLEKSPLDFANEDPPQMITEMGGTADQVQDGLSHEIPHVETATTTEVVQKPGLDKEVAAMGPPVNKRHRKRGKSLASIGLEAGSTFFTPATQKTPADAKSVSDPEPLSYVKPQPHPEQDVAQSSRKTAPEIPTENVATAGVQDLLSTESLGSGKSTSFPSVDGSPGMPPGYFSELRHLPNTDFLIQYNINLARQVAMGSQLRLRFEQEIKMLLRGISEKTNTTLETLLEAEVDMKKAAKAKNAGQAKELESLCVQFLDLQVSNNQLSQQHCAEMDARLEKLSIDFDEELYPHMLTAIVGRRWVIGHGLCLAVMKCAKSLELRQEFANVVSVGLVKGMSEGLEYGIEHGKAGQDLAAVEAYEPEANSNYVKALQDLKDLKYPLVDQLEKLKDAPMELIMASLHLQSDSRKDAP
ncbi:hypothetical protein Tco_0537908 [Tanacetum coccineum]